MVERYPHTVTLIKESEYVQDDQGYMSIGTTLQTAITINCRVVQIGAGPGRSMIGVGELGDVLIPSYTVSLPYISDDYSGGKMVWNGITYNIAKFYHYQARCKIWI